MNIDIGTVSGNTFPSIYALSASHGDRMSLPVSPASYIYSHFKHVSGVPAPDGESGVNITKLKIIDTLIEHLTRLKKQPDPLTEGIEQDDKRINALIEQYQNQLRQMVSGSGPYTPAASPLAGAIFSISA